MIANETLEKVYRIGAEIADLVKSKGGGITFDNAFDHPQVVALRDDLLGLLGDDKSMEKMLDAVAELGAEWDRIHALEPTVENLAKLGAVGGAARALSVLATQRAAEPLQIFRYTMSTVWPYLEGAAKVGVLVIGAVA